ncbi:MAG TPA: class I SAM-dependent methyltransferase [Oligoflexus sp.]|uniref:class I SAM-dependent methyltransferase n=1 Tax=Oligoflexus sp. TaxID=1971216 RepID=UPI002D42312D|nr:class I SAM-dependent methyltransferase [Oligoflexus sp.]HYX37361.1 class I SAM-dependent methyltransferase [Oligoflexus sp.]
MSDQLIQHVSDTAFWVAYYRALEGQRKNPLFSDPLAEVLAGDRGRAIAQQMGHPRIMKWALALRTYVIDSMLIEQIRDGVDTVINLGAGLDTRPYRMDLPSHLQWIEVDFPGVIEFKNARLQHEKPRCQLQRISCDLSQRPERREIFKRLNDSSQRALILTEGVVLYLSEEDAGPLAQDLHEQPHFMYWITDYYSRFLMRLYQLGYIKSHMPQEAPFRFNPKNWEHFYEARGWRLKRMHYLSEVGDVIGRPMAMPWTGRIVWPFMGRKKQKAIRRMLGYGLLQREGVNT